MGLITSVWVVYTYSSTSFITILKYLYFLHTINNNFLFSCTARVSHSNIPRGKFAFIIKEVFEKKQPRDKDVLSVITHYLKGP